MQEENKVQSVGFLTGGERHTGRCRVMHSHMCRRLSPLILKARADLLALLAR